ncbi:ATP:cob(I)alamin adenosyltransferase, variant [Allomyces macrogynus ATCC 38327]|uniref:ATP:cob(I)alamin adenosyltransferase, variant n=1 Tax=Allomyces macrogynus (strain ATCC 38327) TaxID=578462 RepID=A0A0L0SDF9_ALLM3|nr:ATP:cob(I)alamin adenosyltransferase, variant [Allomyces macrogynus ATCC 38327]|eukprot:KNE60462.1 ATP:cob(I)alamin adenosyltransferase, variant [Allomyces macrogynus ATCC 38327]
MQSTAAMLSTRLSRTFLPRAPVAASSAKISRALINASRYFSTPTETPTSAMTENASATTEKASAASPKRIHIYTRTGDKEADNGLAPKLEMIQCLLQDAGANIATPRWCESDAHLKRTEFDPDGAQAALLERWIDDLEDQGLPPLRNFILPSGGRAASALHMARSVCRRAERTVVPLVHDGTASPTVGKYLNRLSDLLFTAARFAAFKDGKPEQVYRSVTSQQAATEARASRTARRGKKVESAEGP